MKTLHIIISLSVVSFLMILSSQAYGIPPISPQEEYVNSDTIVIGKVISAVPFSSTYTKYQIQVEQYLKNPQNQDIITVIAEGTNKTLVEQGRAPDTVYDIGQRALLYLKNENGNYVAWYFSRSTDSLCDPAPTKDDLNFQLSKDARFSALPAYSPLRVDTGIPNLFRVEDTMLIHYDAWNRHFTTKTFDVEFHVKNETSGELLSNVTKQVELKPCIGHQTVDTSFIPKKAGTYEIDVIFDNSLVGTTVEVEHNFSSVKLEKTPIPFPLQQYRSGTAAKDVLCWEGLQLIIKAKDKTPACVKPEDISKLVERGWADKPNSLQEQLDLEHTCIGPNIACRNVMSNSLSESDCGQFYTVPENHTSLNTIPVLLMKTNSTACAKLTFTIISNYNDCNGPNCQHLLDVKPTGLIGNLHYEKHGGSFSITQGKDYTNSFKIVTIPSTVDLANYPIGTNYTVTYLIRPLSNATGFYDQSIPRLACERYPLAVGYMADQVNASDFSYIDTLNPPCVSGAYGLTKVEVSGMDYKEVTLRLAVLEQGK